MKVKIKKLNPLATMPKYQTEGAAAFDLCATEQVIVRPGDWQVIGTGLSFEIPAGYVGYVHARSGSAAKHGIAMVNGVGVIDSDYRGEVKGIVLNNGQMGFQVNVGDRIAQMVIVKLPKVELEEVTELAETTRGENGFGSTGIK